MASIFVSLGVWAGECISHHRVNVIPLIRLDVEIRFSTCMSGGGTERIFSATPRVQRLGAMRPKRILAIGQGLGPRKSDPDPYLPTPTEAIRTLGDVDKRIRLTPFLQKTFDQWLTWTR